jgi:hypothetical protein
MNANCIVSTAIQSRYHYIHSNVTISGPIGVVSNHSVSKRCNYMGSCQIGSGGEA